MRHEFAWDQGFVTMAAPAEGSGRYARRLALTRPEGRNATLLDALRQSGVDVQAFPLMRLQALSFEVPAAASPPYAVIVVSPAAAEWGAHLLPQAWHKNVNICAVGSGTAAQLRAQGWQQLHVPEQENSEGLLTLELLSGEALALSAQDQSVHPSSPAAGKSIMLLRGEGGRELLAQHLLERKALLQEHVVYRRLGPDEETGKALLLWAQHPGTIVISSAEILQTVCSLIAAEQRRTLQALCLGKRIAELAGNQFGQVRVLPDLQLGTLKQALQQHAWRP